MKNVHILLLLIVFTSFSACVSTEKYNEMVQVKEYLEAENKRLTESQESEEQLRAKNRQTQLDLQKARQEVTRLTESLAIVNRNFDDLTNRYNELVIANKSIGTGSATERQYWEETLGQKQVELERCQKEANTLRFTIEQKEKRVQELLALLREKGN